MVNEPDEAIPHDPHAPGKKLTSGPESSTDSSSSTEQGELQTHDQAVSTEAQSRHEYDHYHGAYHGHEGQEPTADLDQGSQGTPPSHALIQDEDAELERRRKHDRERAKAGWRAAGHADDSESVADETDSSVSGEDEEGGGPVKSFLEHLEDLRWVIIRCLAALVVGMVVCLVAANKVVEWLKLPLADAQKMAGKPAMPVAIFSIGTNLWQIPLLTNQIGPIQIASNSLGVKLVMEPVVVGDKMVLGLTPHPLKEEDVQSKTQIQIINLGPVSPFAVAMKIALWGGIGLASPFILFFIGTFVMPALKKIERMYLIRALGIGTLLFCAGVAFCYMFMLSLALNASVQFSTWMSFGAEQWQAEEYIGFVIKFLLGMGLGFELPVLLLTLVKIGLLDYQRLTAYRAYFIVAILVVSAILTPPDPISMIMMAIPLQLLYELSVLIAWFWYRKEKRLEAEAQAAD